MIERLSARGRRRLALAVLAVVALSALTIAIGPIWWINAHYSARIETMRAQLSTLSATARADERLRPKLEQLQRSQLSNGHFLKEGASTVAAAELQGLIKELATANSADILSVQTLAATTEQGLQRIALQVRLQGKYESVVRSLYAIETNRTFLFIENISLQSGSRHAGNRSMGGNSDWIVADIDLAAYMAEAHNES